MGKMEEDEMRGKNFSKKKFLLTHTNRRNVGGVGKRTLRAVGKLGLVGVSRKVGNCGQSHDDLSNRGHQEQPSNRDGEQKSCCEH